MAKPDGGPAFPRPYSQSTLMRTYDAYEQEGMSLRDWFAGMAMAGSLGGVPGGHLSPENLARESYAHADAMLAARERE